MQEIEQHIVEMNGEIPQIRSLLAGLMEVPNYPLILKLVFTLCAVSL
jgi:hypothetical protein